MRQEEIFIAPFLETNVLDHVPVPGADLLPDTVKMDDVFPKRIVGRQVGAAAEPSDCADGTPARDRRP
jgi:hypothetical protein